MIETIKLIIMNILNAQKPYAGSSMMMALYFMALMIIIFYCNDENIRNSLIIPSTVLIAIMYVAVPAINSLGNLLYEHYIGRLFWILITPVITAVGMTLFVTNIKDVKKRFLALVLFFFICLYSGNFKISNDMFFKAENKYRLPQSTVDITEHVLSEKKNPKLIVPYTIAYPFRQISSDVYLLYGEDSTYGRIQMTSEDLVKVSEQMSLTTPDLNYIIPLARDYGVDYIIFDTVYTELCENGNLNIYGYPVDGNYVGDRTPTVSFDDLKYISVEDNENGIYWDLSEYGLEYDGTYGQYILYSL